MCDCRDGFVCGFLEVARHPVQCELLFGLLTLLLVMVVDPVFRYSGLVEGYYRLQALSIACHGEALQNCYSLSHAQSMTTHIAPLMLDTSFSAMIARRS